MADDGIQAQLPGTNTGTGTAPTASPQFDLNAASSAVQGTNDALTEFSKNIISSGSRQGANLPALVDQFQTTHEQFNAGLKGFVDQVDKSRSVIDDAQNNILTSHNVPNFVGNVMGIFGDHRFQPAYQKEIIQNETKNLELTNEKVKSLAGLDEANRVALQTAQSGANTALQTGLEMAQNQRAGISTNIAIQQQQQINAAHLVDGQTLPALMAAAKDPTALQTQNSQVTPGMIQEAIERKQLSDINLRHAGIILDESKTSLTGAKLDLTQKLIGTAITNMSGADLQNYAEQAKNGDGYVNLPVPGDKENHSIRVPGNTFAMALAARQEAVNKLYTSNKDVDIANAQNPVLQKEIDDRSNMYANNPYVTPFVDPVKVAELGRTTGTANQLARTNPLAANEQYKSALATLDSFQKAAIDNAKPDAKPALTQYFNSGGRIDDSTAASDLLTSDVKGSVNSPLSMGDTYGIGDTIARKAFETNMYATKQALPGFGNGSIGGKENVFGTDLKNGGTGVGSSLLGNLTKSPPSDKEVFEHMFAGDTGKAIKSAVTGNMVNKALYGVIKDLATDYPDRQGIQVFKNLMPTGDWADSIKTNGQLDTTKIFSALASDPRNIDILISKLNDPSIRRGFALNDAKVNNTPLHAAYRQRLFNNDVTQIFSPLVAQASQYANIARQNAPIRSQQADAAIAKAAKEQKDASAAAAQRRTGGLGLMQPGQEAETTRNPSEGASVLPTKPNLGIFPLSNNNDQPLDANNIAQIMKKMLGGGGQ